MSCRTFHPTVALADTNAVCVNELDEELLHAINGRLLHWAIAEPSIPTGEGVRKAFAKYFMHNFRAPSTAPTYTSLFKLACDCHYLLSLSYPSIPAGERLTASFNSTCLMTILSLNEFKRKLIAI